jgi:hypothetical protein
LIDYQIKAGQCTYPVTQITTYPADPKALLTPKPLIVSAEDTPTPARSTTESLLNMDTMIVILTNLLVVIVKKNWDEEALQ